MARIREPNYSVRWMAANAPKEIERDLVKALAVALRDHAKLEAPYRSGALVKSILVKDSRVMATAPHALYVHEGTRPHMIYPRHAGGILSWVRRGVRYFARHVHHPGTRPNRFFQRAMERTRQEQSGITQQLLDAWLYRNRIR